MKPGMWCIRSSLARESTASSSSALAGSTVKVLINTRNPEFGSSLTIKFSSVSVILAARGIRHRGCPAQIVVRSHQFVEDPHELPALRLRKRSKHAVLSAHDRRHHIFEQRAALFRQ